MYDNKSGLNKNNGELYNCFDAAYTADAKTFTNPKSLYTYFSLMVDLYDGGQKPAQALFNKYDDINEKIESEIKNYTQKLNKYITADGEEEVELPKKKQGKRNPMKVMCPLTIR